MTSIEDRRIPKAMEYLLGKKLTCFVEDFSELMSYDSFAKEHPDSRVLFMSAINRLQIYMGVELLLVPVVVVVALSGRVGKFNPAPLILTAIALAATFRLTANYAFKDLMEEVRIVKRAYIKRDDALMLEHVAFMETAYGWTEDEQMLELMTKEEYNEWKVEMEAFLRTQIIS